MEDFESCLAAARLTVERYVRFRLRDSGDAEDVFQEVCTLAYLRFSQLRDKGAFQAWILAIARSQCAEYYRKKGKRQEVPLEEMPEGALVYGRRGISVSSPVEETMELLTEGDRELLRLAYWQELPQAEIAAKLGIPVGTVKSRLHAARAHFKAAYPYPPRIPEGAKSMTKLPEYIPEYTIERLEEAPFSCRWEETQGWMIIPKVGEKLTWGMYDFPEKKRTEYTEIEVTREAEIHGIRGVEVVAEQFYASDYYRTGSQMESEWRFIAQLTDTHSRFLAASCIQDGVRRCWTFLDGEPFLENWGFGPDNIGNEVNLAPKGLLKREGNTITGVIPREVVDVVGRYRVTIGGKSYDTVCVMDVECFNDAVASEQFLDKNGRTVLWRRFNRDDWAIDRFGGKPWSEKLPENERLYINGETYVHWYDCLSDYVL